MTVQMYRIRCLECDSECPDWFGFKSYGEAKAEADRWQRSLDRKHVLAVEPEPGASHG